MQRTPTVPLETGIPPKNRLALPAQLQTARGGSWRTCPDSKVCPTATTIPVSLARKSRERFHKRRMAPPAGILSGFVQGWFSTLKRDATKPSRIEHDAETRASRVFPPP